MIKTQIGDTQTRQLAHSDAAKRHHLRKLVGGIYTRAQRDWQGAPSVLAKAFREELGRALHSTERRLVADVLYGMVRERRWLLFALGAEEGGVEPAELMFLAYLYQTAPDADRNSVRAELSALGIDIRDFDGAEKRLAKNPNEAERIAIRLSYPTWLVERFVAELGVDHARTLLDSMNHRAPLFARVNLNRISRDALIERLATENIPAIPHATLPAALELDTHVNIYGLTSFREGLFELQDIGSQWIAEAVAPPPQSRFVDACAGAGGKTLAVAQLLANRGRILAMDITGHKLDELKERARRAQINNVSTQLMNADTPVLPEKWLGQAERVLVDAPCSGTGVFRRNPEAKWRVFPEDVTKLAALQLQILRAYAPLVRPGGRLIYATCSILRDENEAVIERFLAAEPRFAKMSIKEILGGTKTEGLLADGNLRLYPDRHDSDGFFAAVLVAPK